MRKFTIFIAAALFAAAAMPAEAQMGGGPPASAAPTPSEQGPTSKNLSQGEINQLSDYIDKSQRLTKKTKPEDKAKDKADAIATVKALALPCDVTDADAVAAGQTNAAGKLIDTTTYEIACSNGMGYFVVSQNPEKPLGLSCFAADALNTADLKTGKTGDAICELPANASMQAMAASVLSHTGKSCAPKAYAWVGESEKTNLDYTELACEDGTGYVLATAAQGSSAAPAAWTCPDSAARGIKCTMSSNGAAATGPITLQTFKDALVQHGVDCRPGDERVIGQENVQKRYVVEFTCPGKPAGLVAFIPLGDNTSKFEALSCTDAAKRGIFCKLTTKN